LIIFFKDDVVLRDLLTKKIPHFNIDIKYRMLLITKTALEIFELILSLCQNLTTFNFGDMLFSRKRVISFFTIQSRSKTYSTLTKLKINVENFFDLAYLLDGRFYCLSTLIASVSDHYGPTNIDRIVSRRISVFMLRNKNTFQLFTNVFRCRNNFRH
jgi:hypothetical protein